MKLLKDEWFPFVTRTVKANHGWDTFYYGNLANPAGRGRGRGSTAGDGGATAPARGGEPPAQAAAGPRAWSTFEHGPRFHNNYVGLRNRFALLSEAYSYATFEDRIKATSYFLDAALAFAHQNATRVTRAVEAADKESIVGKPQATRAQFRRGGMIEILMGDIDKVANPNNGAELYLRKNVVKPEQMVDMLWFEPTTTEVVAAEYYVPAAATKALDLLKAHGIQMRPLPQPARGVEQFVIDANTTAPNPFEGHAMRRLEGKWQPAPDVQVPAGAWVVAMNQPLARLAFYLLEPMSDDGLVTWNALDDVLKDAKTYPILRKR